MQTILVRFSEAMSFKKGEFMLMNMRNTTQGYVWDVKKILCTKCYDKGYSTVMSGVIGYKDFPGDKGFKDEPTVKKRYCTCPLGKRMQKKDEAQPELYTVSSKEFRKGLKKAKKRPLDRK